MEPARDKGAQEIEGQDERLLGDPRLDGPGGLQEAQVRGDAGVGQDGDVRSPSQVKPEPLRARGRRSPFRKRGLAAPAQRIEAPDAEIASRDEDRSHRGTPCGRRNRGDEPPDRREPLGGGRLIQRAPGIEGERHRVAARPPEHGHGPQGRGTGEKGGMGGPRVAEGRDAAPGGDAHGCEGVGHAAKVGLPFRTAAWRDRRARG